MEDPVITIGTIIGIALLSVATAWINTRLAADEKYNLPINPANFTASITNPYFSLPVGRRLVYEQRDRRRQGTHRDPRPWLDEKSVRRSNAGILVSGLL